MKSEELSMVLFPTKLSSFELIKKTRKEFEKNDLIDFDIDTVTFYQLINNRLKEFQYV